MAKKKRTVHSLKRELITKSQEAALGAIRVFNDPQVTFKSETFIVLMMIAWTYLLHAHYRTNRVEYRHYKQGPKRKVFDRTTRGRHKYWELERCLNCDECPIDTDVANNLRFLIGLRHEIEHQMTVALDNYLSGRYQACAINYNTYIRKLFGDEWGIDSYMTYSIQFMSMTDEQVTGPLPDAEVPANLRAYIVEFDSNLTEEQFNSERYSFRLLFTKKLANRPGQADQVVEFIDPKSELAKEIDKQYWVKREVERPKFRPTDVVAAVRGAGFPKFKIQPHHRDMWKNQDAKGPGKGYGVDVSGSWFWYQNWIDRCIELCMAAGDTYR